MDAEIAQLMGVRFWKFETVNGPKCCTVYGTDKPIDPQYTEVTPAEALKIGFNKGEGIKPYSTENDDALEFAESMRSLGYLVHIIILRDKGYECSITGIFKHPVDGRMDFSVVEGSNLAHVICAASLNFLNGDTKGIKRYAYQVTDIESSN